MAYSGSLTVRQIFADLADKLLRTETSDEFLLRNDIGAPVPFASTKDTGLRTTVSTEYPSGIDSFEVSGIFPAGDAAGSYYIGSKDLANSYRFFFTGSSGTILEVYKIVGGTQTSVGVVTGFPKVEAGQRLTLRIMDQGTAKYRLAVLIDGVERWFALVDPISGGKSFRWNSFAPTAATDLYFSEAADGLRIVYSGFLSNDDRRPEATIEYTTLATDPDPLGIEVQWQSMDGTALGPYRPVQLVSSTAGLVDVVGPDAPPAVALGRKVRAVYRQQAVPTRRASTALRNLGRTKFGTNIGGFFSWTSFDRCRAFANLLHQGGMERDKLYSNTNQTTDVDPYINHREGRILSVPVDDVAAKGRLIWRFIPPDASGDFYLRWEGDKNLEVQFGTMTGGIGFVLDSTIETVAPSSYRRKLSMNGVAWKDGQECFMRLISVGSGVNNLDIREVAMDRSLFWNPTYVARTAEKPGAIRFMDARRTNHMASSTLTWNQRLLKTSLFMGRDDGTPIEACIELCNLTNRDMWLCWYYKTSAEFNTQLAAAVDRGLGTTNGVGLKLSLTLYAELMNEVWNPTFAIWRYIREVGYAEGRLTQEESNNHGGTLREYAYAHDRVMLDVEAGITSGRPLVRVYGSQLEANPFFYIAALSIGLKRVDAVAFALYWGITDAELPEVRSPANLVPPYRRAMLALQDVFMKASDAVLDRGPRVLCYEFNQDFATAPGLTASERTAFCRSSEIRPLWDEHLDWQIKNVGDASAQYADAPSLTSQMYCWGLDEYQGQPMSETPRRAALLAAIAVA